MIKTLVDDDIEAGHHTITWDGTDESNQPVHSGVYLYQLKTDQNDQEVKRMILLK